ncbi:hypothetical protein ACS0TY_002016 [Phlomoides rotata]
MEPLPFGTKTAGYAEMSHAACTFNNDGSIYAYSVCCDWSKGAENHNPSTAKTYIVIRGTYIRQVYFEFLFIDTRTFVS